MANLSSREKTLTVTYIIATLSLIIVGVVLFLFWNEHHFKRYDRPQNNFAISYPSDWKMAENTNNVNVIFYSPLDNDLDFFQENVNVLERSYPGDPKDIKAYAEMAVDQMQAVFKGNFILLEMQPTLLASYPAYRIGFIGKGAQGELKFLILCVRKEDVSYQITYAAVSSQYDKYLDKINKMLGSFKIK